MITLALVDDHQLFRKSLAVLLNTFDGVSVVYDTNNGQLLLDFLENNTVDMVLLDIQMPIMTGFEICEYLKINYPDIKVLIISQLTTKEAVHKVMELGANGFFTKNSPPEQLEMAINSIIEKDYYFDLELSAVIREAILWEKKTAVKLSHETAVQLSHREIEIIKLSCKGFSSKEIATTLFISLRTVEKHRNRIIEKCGCKNFIEVILFALKNNFIDLEAL